MSSFIAVAKESFPGFEIGNHYECECFGRKKWIRGFGYITDEEFEILFTTFELSKEDKISLYKDMRASILSNNYGFCNAYHHNIDVYYNGWSNLSCFLPELQKYRPAVHGLYWFPVDDEGIAKRIRILDEIIQSLND